MRQLADDLAFAARQLRSARKWSVLLVVVLASGIALTLAAFLLIDSVLFRPIGITEQDRVVRVGLTSDSREYLNSISWKMVELFRGADAVFTDVAAEGPPESLDFRLADGSRERLRGRAVTGNYFDVLGIPVAAGRALLPRDDRFQADPVAVVSDRFWRRHMQASAGAVGQRIVIGTTSYAVVGVAAPAFRGMEIEALDVWLPARVAMKPEAVWTDIGWNSFEAFARLAPEVTLAQANAMTDAAAKNRPDDGSGNGSSGMAVPVTRLGNFVRDGDEVRGAMLLGAGAIAMLLLSCVNAACLLLVRAERRRGELALRASLGAGRGRLMRQQLMEATLPVALACAIGMIAGYSLALLAIDAAGAKGVIGVTRGDLPGLSRSLALIAATLLACSLVCALPAMLRAGRSALSAEVAGGFNSGARGGRRWHSGKALVAMQFALTIAVAGTGALFLNRFVEHWRAPVGLERMSTLVLQLPLDHRTSKEEGDVAYRQVLDDVRGSPLVSIVAVGGMVPITRSSMTTMAELNDAAEPRMVGGFYNPVSADFFRTLGISLQEGRLFDGRDVAGSPPVTIVSADSAKRLWPNESAIGKSIRWRIRDGQPPVLSTVVGVVADVRYRSATEPLNIMYYVPVEQRTFGGANSLIATPSVGASDGAVRALLRDASSRLRSDRAPGSIETVDERVNAAIAAPRFLASVATAFGSLAVLLAATGIYAAFAFLVSARRRELGIRLAIGSTPRSLFWLVLGEASRLIAVGVVIGALVGISLGKIATVYTIDLPPMRVLSLAAVVTVIAVAGLLAVIPSARLAAKTDPQASLRNE